MRSRRSRFETACRVCAFGVLGWLLGTSLIPASGRRVERASEHNAGSRLAAWTRMPPNVGLHGDFATTPDGWVIDWLAALERSGHAVSWSGSPPAVAMVAEAVGDPRGGARVDVAAPAGARVAIRDDASVIDSLTVATLGGSVTTPVVVGRVVATTGGQTLSVGAPDSTRVRSIVVVGGAGWEGKFIADALEERGWPVVVRFSVAPNVDVGPATDAPLMLDTGRVAAVVAVDTALQGLGGAIERYVRSGGGLVLAGPSGLAQSTASLAPGTLGVRVRPSTVPTDTLALGSTGFYPVSALKEDAIALERRAGGVTVAARRVGAGRVMQVGYDDSWRWRMAGGDGSEDAHRAWWSHVVSAVAYAPEVRTMAPAAVPSAPLAYLVDRLGPSRLVPAGIAARGPLDPRILMTLIMVLLLAEWGSRRARGLR